MLFAVPAAVNTTGLFAGLSAELAAMLTAGVAAVSAVGVAAVLTLAYRG